MVTLLELTVARKKEETLKLPLNVTVLTLNPNPWNFSPGSTYENMLSSNRGWGMDRKNYGNLEKPRIKY